MFSLFPYLLCLKQVQKLQKLKLYNEKDVSYGIKACVFIQNILCNKVFSLLVNQAEGLRPMWHIIHVYACIKYGDIVEHRITIWLKNYEQNMLYKRILVLQKQNKKYLGLKSVLSIIYITHMFARKLKKQKMTVNTITSVIYMYYGKQLYNKYKFI